MTLSIINTQLPKFINFRDPETLKSYCGQDFSASATLKVALGVAREFYEKERRLILGEFQGSYAFAMNPEILAHAMRLAKNEIVMELAGASGENAALLAFSDAKEVYYNEIEPREVQLFEKMKKSLPQMIQAKLKVIEGNCLDIPLKNVEVLKQVGLLLCFNLIHFFNDREMSNFFDLLKKVLKPGGQAIITVNSAHNFPIDEQKLMDKHPDLTSFLMTFCAYQDHQVKEEEFIFEEFSPCTSDSISYKDSTICLYEKKLGSQWKSNNQEFKKLPGEIRNKIKAGLEENKSQIAAIKEGSVYVVKSYLRVFRVTNLANLFTKNGFEVELSFGVRADGHLVEELSETSQIGVIVKYSG